MFSIFNQLVVRCLLLPLEYHMCTSFVRVHFSWKTLCGLCYGRFIAFVILYLSLLSLLCYFLSILQIWHVFQCKANLEQKTTQKQNNRYPTHVTISKLMFSTFPLHARFACNATTRNSFQENGRVCRKPCWILKKSFT